MHEDTDDVVDVSPQNQCMLDQAPQSLSAGLVGHVDAMRAQQIASKHRQHQNESIALCWKDGLRL
jgi:hypothetical protein